MANIVITSTPTAVTVDYGDYGDTIGFVSETLRRDQLAVNLWADVTCVALNLRNWGLLLSYDGQNNSHQVDTVDGVAPTSNTDLFDKLTDLVSS